MIDIVMFSQSVFEEKIRCPNITIYKNNENVSCCIYTIAKGEIVTENNYLQEKC